MTKDPKGAWSDLAVKTQGSCIMNGHNETDPGSGHWKIRILTAPLKTGLFHFGEIVGKQYNYSNRSGLYVGKRW